ncbi:uncharacterized protein LOC127011747 [Drosophila biarmipes]|uniref:uncharacterized protein LOC127011747 n=1 Tax=Drosophila biarmipes TaxID=125945 RepID=UPI0021CD0AE2|nr:uncharacterized protein LOC127011747 [Drosophila biarmipes]XP_050745781.1 uncharacterized protein LOC127011747 [Drosophila biarmipes]XP_050745782.1 uncharacterized protein LOC127011747 [Drosophila biarmipes]XP_050745783.1 uncharacterized protein LOC127011747 [Drosophila biarmipes]
MAIIKFLISTELDINKTRKKAIVECLDTFFGSVLQMPQYCIPMDLTIEIDHLEIPETQDSDVEVIENSDQEVVDASDTENSLDRLLRRVFQTAAASTQERPGIVLSAWSQFPMGTATQAALESLILSDEGQDQFQCGQEIELDESIPTEMFPAKPYLNMLDDKDDSALLDVLFSLDY